MARFARIAAAAGGILALAACTGTSREDTRTAYGGLTYGSGSGSGSGSGAGPDAGTGAGSDAGTGAGSDAGTGDDPDAGVPGDAGDGGLDAGTDAPPDGPICQHVTSNLASLLAGVTVLDDTTPQGLIDALILEVDALLAACPYASPCPEDVAALLKLLRRLSDLPLGEPLSDARRDQLLSLQSAAWRAFTCIGSSPAPDPDPDPDPEPEPEPFTPRCGGGEWDRRLPYFASPALPDLRGCTALAVSSGGGWAHVGATAPVGVGPFSAWERGFDDDGYLLWPASELLDQLGLSTSSIGYFQSPGSFQFASSLPLAPYLPAIRANGTAVILYGRNNATSAYVLDPVPYFGRSEILDYEYGPRRDSIKILGCSPEQLEGWPQLTFGSRQARAVPWWPLVPDQPGLWAVLATCPASPPPQPTPQPTPPPAPSTHALRAP